MNSYKVQYVKVSAGFLLADQYSADVLGSEIKRTEKRNKAAR